MCNFIGIKQQDGHQHYFLFSPRYDDEKVKAQKERSVVVAVVYCQFYNGVIFTIAWKRITLFLSGTDRRLCTSS